MIALRKITTEELKEILEKHLKWSNGDPYGRKAYLHSANLHSADLSSADLRSANLSFADLSFADLRSADLRSANLDFSSGFSFQCSSFDVKIDLKIGSQLAYHFCRMCAEDHDVKKAQESLKELANKFHRVNECGKLGDE